MQTIKIIITILNILMVSLLIFFTRGLNWKYQKDHASIIGFNFLIFLYTANMILIWY